MKSDVVVQTHGFRVTPRNVATKNALHKVLNKLIEWDRVDNGPEGFKWEIKKLFATLNKTDKSYFVCKGLYKTFIDEVTKFGNVLTDLNITERSLFKTSEAIYHTNDMPTPYDYQEPIIEHLLDVTEGVWGRTKGTNLQAGKGKTLCAIQAIVKAGGKACIHMSAGYIKRWLPDLEKFLGLKEGVGIRVIRGFADLESIFQEALDGDAKYQVYVVSHTTLQGYLKEYSDEEDFNYSVEPQDFYSALDVRTALVDEIHENYHFMFKWISCAHVSKFIMMSATMETMKSHIRRMYTYLNPKECWLGMKYDAYVTAKAYHFRYNPKLRIRFKQRGRKFYSHDVFEESIIKEKKFSNDYYEMIRAKSFHEFRDVGVYREGMKLLILCSKVDMCYYLEKYLKSTEPGYKYAVHVHGCDLHESIKADVIISTVASMGTGQDIPDLKVVILTRAIDSLEQNEQIKGRLRKPKGKNIDMKPVIVYFVCQNIPAHIKYHENKLKAWDGKVIQHITEYHRLPLG